MPILLHGGVLCPLELVMVLSGVASSWGVLVYLSACLRRRIFQDF